MSAAVLRGSAPAEDESGTIAGVNANRGPGGDWPAFEMERLRVVVVSEYPTVRAGLRALLEASEGIGVVAERSPTTLGEVELPDAEVVVVDAGEHEAAVLQESFPGVPLVVVGAHAEDVAADMRGLTAPRAYLTREAGEEELAAAVRAVAQGLTVFSPALLSAREPSLPVREPSPHLLTERELEVLPLLADGLPNKAIALRLGISEHTVKFHVGAILSKLGAASRTEAVVLAARRGLLPL